LDWIDAGASGFNAPLVHWRQFLPALVPPAVIIGAGVLLVDVLGDRIDFMRSDHKLLALAIFWLALSSFAWCWIKGLCDRRQKWWRPLLQFGPSFWSYMIVSAALFFSAHAVGFAQDYLSLHLGTAKLAGSETMYVPSLLGIILSFTLVFAWAWLRIRLILWPIDIAITGRLRHPSHSWSLTRGRVGEFLGMWLLMSLMAGLVITVVVVLGNVFLDESMHIFLWFFAFLYAMAALDAAYLSAYMGSRKQAGSVETPATA
jgi:hypothetical protein